MAVIKDMISPLEIMADDKKKGGVEKSAIAGMNNRRLGLDAQQNESALMTGGMTCNR